MSCKSTHQEVSPILVSAEVVPEYHVGVALVHLEEVAEVEEVDLEAKGEKNTYIL